MQIAFAVFFVKIVWLSKWLYKGALVIYVTSIVNQSEYTKSDSKWLCGKDVDL